MFWIKSRAIFLPYSLLILLIFASSFSGCGSFGSDGGNGVFGNQNSFALDSAGFGHIVYNSPAGLKYATNKNGGWVKELITAKNSSPTLAVDKNGHCHVVYYDPSNGLYVYTNNISGAWADQTIQSGAGYNYSASLVLDDSSNPHVAFSCTNLGFKEAMVYYANRQGGSWEVTNPLKDYPYGMEASIGRDPSNNTIHIIAINPKLNSLYLASCSLETWTTQEITNIGSENNGYYLATMIAKNSIISVVYNDFNGYPDINGRLKFSSNKSGIWALEYIDLFADSAALGSDSNTKYHIIYKRSNVLKYATNSTGSWESNILFTDPGEVGISAGGGSVSLAIDDADRLYGTYYEDTSHSGQFDPISEGKIYFITNKTGTWERTLIDP